MMNVNGFYSTYRHASQRKAGRLWQGRFFSCVLDHTDWVTALRYVALNPVLVRILQNAEDHRWSFRPRPPRA